MKRIHIGIRPQLIILMILVMGISLTILAIVTVRKLKYEALSGS